MKIRWRKGLLAGAAGLGLVAGAAEANLVANGGFEAGLSSWAVSGFQLQDYDYGIGDIAHAGTQAFYGGGVADPGYIHQSLTTVPGQDYRLSFWMFSDGFAPNEFRLLVGGNVAYDAVDVPLQAFREVRLDFRAASNSTQLWLGFRNDSGFLRVDDIDVSPVPEPATAALAGLGLMVLMTMRRRCRA